MIGSINGYEIGILLVVVLLVVGPERLPGYAQQLGRLVRELRDMARGASARVKEEMGDSFEDLRDLDPRQYDPRRIVREALFDDPPAAGEQQPASRFVAPVPPMMPATAPYGAAAVATPGAQPAPFDDEAT